MTPPLSPPLAARRSRRLIAAAILAAALLLIFLVTRFLGRKGPPPSASSADVARFIATDRFDALPRTQRRAFVDRIAADPAQLDRALNDASLPNLARQRILHQVFAVQMQKRVDGYFAQPPGPQRARYLDDTINQQEQRQAAGDAALPPAGPDSPPPAPGAFLPSLPSPPAAGKSPGAAPGAGQPHPLAPPDQGSAIRQMKNEIENMSAEDRARTSEFVRALGQRRRERGLSP